MTTSAALAGVSRWSVVGSRGTDSACAFCRGVGIQGIHSPGMPQRLFGLRLQQAARQLRSRLHADLPKHLVQVVFDRAWRDEQLYGNLVVRRALGDELRNLCLLRRQF